MDAATAAATDGIFIPVGVNLPGLLAEELDPAVPLPTRLGKIYFSLLLKIKTYLDANPDIVGISASLAEELDDSRPGTKTKTYTLISQEIIDDRSKLANYPSPAISGIYTGSADFAFTDIFPGAVKIAAAALTSGAGIVIGKAELEAESPFDYATADLSTDSRELVRALGSAMYSARSLRSDVVASGLVFASFARGSAPITPTSWYDSINPRTAIDADEIGYLTIHQRSMSFSVETIEDEVAQTFDVNSIVTPA